MAGLGRWFGGWLGGRASDQPTGIPRLSAAERPALIYAVGDVHGCLDALKGLEAKIVADAAGRPGEKWLVMLGDYVDRGPQSAQVLDHLTAPPPPGFTRICLRGNHEAAMLAALRDGASIERWLAFGGEATLASYGLNATQISMLAGPGKARNKLQLLQAYVPDEHVGFLTGLPVMLSVPGYVFVHAGLRPGVTLDRQRDSDMLWIRDEFLAADHDFGVTVVHGHTPAVEPFLSAHRIGIDTGCFASGRLTGLRVDAEGATVLA